MAALCSSPVRVARPVRLETAADGSIRQRFSSSHSHAHRWFLLVGSSSGLRDVATMRPELSSSRPGRCPASPGEGRRRPLEPLPTLRKAGACVPRAAGGGEEVSAGAPEMAEDEEAVGLEILEEFIALNSGTWAGTFSQFDLDGQVAHRVPTQLVAAARGEGRGASLAQTLRVLEAAPSRGAAAPGGAPQEPVWREHVLEEVNLQTLGGLQQGALFPGRRAFALAHQSAAVIDRVLRVGVLGAADTGEDFHPGVKLPSRRPALVSESCLYDDSGRRRVRAFFVLDPRGFLDTIGVFEESRGEGSGSGSGGGRAHPLEAGVEGGAQAHGAGGDERLAAVLGEWRGRGSSLRSALYGATVVDHELVLNCKLEPGGPFVQEMTYTTKDFSRKMSLRAAVEGNTLRFDGGLRMVLLPNNLAMSSPSCVARGQAFSFEFTWVDEAASSRRRLVRTYDTEGMVVSTTLATEQKVV